MTPGPGTPLAAGRYRLERPLGAGGMASVWLAHDTRLDRRVAIKLVADAPASDPQWSTRFVREARAAAAVTHPNIVTVYDQGLEDGRPYLVMTHVPGPNLAELLRDPGPGLPPAERLVDEILAALNAVHRAGIVHRDVKAANVLVDDEGHARLADFGIARTEGSSALTSTGMVIGTVRYLAPEVAQGRPATVASDLFAAGVLVRELAAVRLSPALDDLADALTQPEPLNRPASAADARLLLDASTTASGATASTRRHAGPARPVVPGVPPAPGDRLRLPGRPAGRPTARTPAAAPASDPPASAARPSARARRRAAAAAVALLAVVVIVTAVLLSGTGHGRRSAAGPAAPDAPLTEQLRSLQHAVDGVGP